MTTAVCEQETQELPQTEIEVFEAMAQTMDERFALVAQGGRVQWDVVVLFRLLILAVKRLGQLMYDVEDLQQRMTAIEAARENRQEASLEREAKARARRAK